MAAATTAAAAAAAAEVVDDFVFVDGQVSDGVPDDVVDDAVSVSNARNKSCSICDVILEAIGLFFRLSTLDELAVSLLEVYDGLPSSSGSLSRSSTIKVFKTLTDG